jgi:hypothetical protein
MDSHTPPPNSDVNPLSLQQGHEPDKIDTRTVVYVPIVLLICFLLSWVTVTLVFNYVRGGPAERPKNREAAIRQAAPINERLARINSSTPLAEVKQPRLEGLNELKNENEPPFLRSFEPLTDPSSGNSPHFHPDDLRPNSERSKELGLQSYSWIKKDELARIPIEEALKTVLKAKKPKGPGKEKEKEESYISFQQKDGKPVQLSDLLKGGPTAANPQATYTSPKAPGPGVQP